MRLCFRQLSAHGEALVRFALGGVASYLLPLEFCDRCCCSRHSTPESLKTLKASDRILEQHPIRVVYYDFVVHECQLYKALLQLMENLRACVACFASIFGLFPGLTRFCGDPMNPACVVTADFLLLPTSATACKPAFNQYRFSNKFQAGSWLGQCNRYLTVRFETSSF